MYDEFGFAQSEWLPGGVGREYKRCSKFMFGPNFLKVFILPLTSISKG